MPAWEVWLAYVAATSVLLAVPGPTVMLVVSYALERGPRAALSTVPGVALGDFTAMALSFLGLGALLATSAALFGALKWVGAAYLIYLGAQKWRTAPAAAALAPEAPSRLPRAVLAHCWVVTALNPKGIVFFVAYVPQFMAPHAPAAPQLVALGATFLVLAMLSATAYALLAGGVRQAVRRPAVLRAINRVSGGLLIGAGAMTAALHRGS